MAAKMKSKYKVTIKGPLLIKGDKNMMKGIRKGLINVGKSVTKKVKQNLPIDVSGNLRRNIKESKPTIKKKSAQIIISSGSGHGGASSVRTGAGDVIYARWIETGKRRNMYMKKRRGGYKMFKKAEKSVNSAKNISHFEKLISKELGGR
tara:strand:- start:445 stop:891 length:447 start_codon:yes stop_codon:yes gene_type:complete